MEICFYKVECSEMSLRNFQAVQQASSDKRLYHVWILAPAGVQNEISNIFCRISGVPIYGSYDCKRIYYHLSFIIRKFQLQNIQNPLKS